MPDSTGDHNRLSEQPSTRALRRLQVVDAFIDLVLQGGAPPTPRDIAERAGVSRATFFRYFSSLNEFRGETVARVRERFPELFAIPDIGTGSLDQRIERFVDSRLRLHEALHPLALHMRANAARDADASGIAEGVRQAMVDQVGRHFAGLLPADPERREDVVAAIAALTSVDSWQQFRHSHGRSPAQTRRAWRMALVGILAQT
jgi:AcrR family transcriptional regulator